MTAAIALAGVSMAANATVGSTQTQEGYQLTNVYSLDGVAPANATAARSGVGIGDKFFVNEYATGVKVYDKEGTLLKTIAAPEGYHCWVSCNLDAAGHLLVQLDTKAFDGSCSPNGNHGFMVIDTETLEVLNEFIPMTFGYAQRFDAMAPVDKNILVDYNTRIIAPLNTATTEYQFSYNQTEGSGYWKTAAFTANAFDEFPAAAQKCTSTGYAMQYTDLEGNVLLANYPNPVYNLTYSGEGKHGNGILKCTGNWKSSGQFIYTPMHSGYTGFNIFTLAGKQYIIYPAGGAVNSGDAFAISEVTFVDSPLTDMTMEGETLVDGKLAGPLVARVYAAVTEAGAVKYASAAACAPSYTIEPVEGDENSVYIYTYAAATPANKWKFTVVKEEEKPEPVESGSYVCAFKAGLIDAGGTFSEKVSAYTKTFTNVYEGYSWTISNFNNNNAGWDFVRAGSKSAASVATITTDFAPAQEINKVVVNIGKVGGVTEAYLLTSATEDFAEATKTPIENLAAGDVTIKIAEPAGNLYYRLVFDCEKGASNGSLQVNRIEYFYGDEEVVEPVEPIEGGTLEDPYTVAEALEVISRGPSADEVYVQGYVIEVTELSTQYGNATYTIADSADATEGLIVFRGYGLEGEKFTSEDDLKVGAEVIVLGTLVNYNGVTPEVGTGNQLVSYKYDDITGVDAVEAALDAPVEYYNLQGIRVANPENGIFIRRQGNKVSKVVL